VICGTSGRGRIVLGDSDGMLHYISRQLESRKVAEAHLAGFIQIEQLKLTPFLITLGVSLSIIDLKLTLFWVDFVVQLLMLLPFSERRDRFILHQGLG